MRKCIYAASLDIIHNGHVWMVNEGASLFDEICILVSVNADKKHMLNFDERLALAKAIFEPLGKNIKVAGLENEFVVNYATRNGYQYLLRGIRSNLDYEYEANIANINQDIAEDKKINSVFLMPPQNLKSMSSSMIRGLIGFKGWEQIIEQYVPEKMAEYLYYKKSGNANLRVNYLLEKYSIDYSAEKLMSEYGSLDRFYHNWKHIEECIEQFARVKNRLDEPDVVEMAIYFHDIVYNVQRDDNESVSSVFFHAAAIKCKDTDFRDKVTKMIRETKWFGNRYPKNIDGDMEYMHDIDYSIFAADLDRFLEYDAGIAQEYSVTVNAENFATLRRGFLEDMTRGNKKVFLTDLFDNERADYNIRKVLERRYP